MTDARNVVFVRVVALMTGSLLAAGCDGTRDGGAVDLERSALRAGSPRGGDADGDDHGANALRGRAHRHGRPGHEGTGAGPCAGAGGAAGGAAVAINPDATGWVDGSTNAVGIQGNWFPFADSYGPDGARNGECQAAGHADSECTVITTPDPASGAFPNVGGKMCTSGTIAQVLLLNGEPDYGHMWGGGIGLNLAVTARAGGILGTFDAQAHAVVCISFDIDTVPVGGLRVMFPTPATDAIPVVGPDYWGASATYPPSPVVPGTNVVMFSDVRSPESAPQPLDVSQIRSLLFLVPGAVFSATDFAYCISNVKMLLR